MLEKLLVLHNSRITKLTVQHNNTNYAQYLFNATYYFMNKGDDHLWNLVQGAEIYVQTTSMHSTHAHKTNEK